jgi:hypothetical protein
VHLPKLYRLSGRARGEGEVELRGRRSHGAIIADIGIDRTDPIKLPAIALTGLFIPVLPPYSRCDFLECGHELIRPKS